MARLGGRAIEGEPQAVRMRTTYQPRGWSELRASADNPHDSLVVALPILAFSSWCNSQHRD